MTSEDDKLLYTTQNMLHAQVMVLGEMLFERIAAGSGETIDALQAEWRDRRRAKFLETMQELLSHPATVSPIPAETMLQTAEAIWRREDAS